MSKLIYIVDDQPGVLITLGFLLRRIDPTWKVVEFSNPLETIEAVRIAPPNLVLADQTMPEMLGTEMLEQIRRLAPQTVRIIISGHAARLDNMGAAHQYLTKPFENSALTKTIHNAVVAQESLSNPDLARLVASLRSFPVLPAVYTRLIGELEKETTPSETIISLLNDDPAILSRLLQVANSPLFRGRLPIVRASDALFQLGTRLVTALVFSLHVFENRKDLCFPEMPLDALWQHSLETARIGQTLCRLKLSEDAANAAFFAGLVHDLGRLILIENQPEHYLEACQAARASGTPLSIEEQRIFGITHSELAAFMLRLWGMESAVVEAVSKCEVIPGFSGFSITSAVYLANIFSRQTNSPDQLMTPEIDSKLLEHFGLADFEPQHGGHDLTTGR
jgi:HD-like signal output (HDOD) protein